MRTRRASLAAFLAATTAMAAGVTPLPPAAARHPHSCAPLNVRNADGNYIVPGVRGDIPYSGNLALDAYIQPDPRRRASIVVIHGGNWSAGSRVAHVGQILELLTRAGYNWFSIDYRLGGIARHDESLADVREALAFVRCHAARFGIDPSRLFLVGEDSGAHLAALLAAERPAGVIGAVLIGGFYDLGGIPAIAGTLSSDALSEASPIGRIVRGMPPVLLVHGQNDVEAPLEQARRYCLAATRVEALCELLEVAGASHRSENWWPSQWSYKDHVVAWLSSVAPVAAPRKESPRAVLRKNIVYDPATQLKLDAFVPSNARERTPAILLVHGGGWEAGDKVTYITPLFEPLARAGLAWFSVDYRLTPAVTHEEQLEDVRTAIRFLRREHARFNVDPSRIVLIGESASGQMAALLASEDRALAGVVSFYGVYDFPAMVSDASPRSLLVRLFRRTALDDGARELLRRYSPLHRAHKDMPPMLLIHGTGDRLSIQGRSFAARLAELGVPHDVVELEGAPHGMENWEGHPEWTAYKQTAIDWIRRTTRQR